MKKELSMETRLLIAFVLMGLVLMVSQYFVKPAPGPGATKSAAKAEPANSSAEKKDEVIPSPAQQRAAQVAGEEIGRAHV